MCLNSHPYYINIMFVHYMSYSYMRYACVYNIYVSEINNKKKSSKPYILLSRNLMESFRQHRDSEVAKIIPFAYERLPSTKQPSWNSSNIIIFQTIYPLKQKLDGRQQADRLHRKAKIIPLRCQRGSSIEQRSWISSNIIFIQTIYPLEQKLDGRLLSTWRLRNSLKHPICIPKIA